MSVTLGRLIISLEAQTSAFQKGMQSAQKLAFDSSDAIVASLGRIGDRISRLKFDDFEKSLKSLSIAGGVLAGVGAGIASTVLVISKQVAEHAHQMDLLSQKYGVSVENLSSMRVAAKLSGLDLETLALGMGRLAKNAATVAEQTGGHAQAGAAAAFRILGVETKNADGTLRPMMPLMSDIAERFSKMADGTGKTALAMQLFGRAGAQLIPFLNQGKAGIEEMRRLSDELGLTWSQKDVQAAAQFAERLEILDLKGTALKEQIARGVLPALENLATIFLRTDSAGKNLASTFGQTMGAAITYVATKFADAQYSAGLFLLQMQKLANIAAVSPLAYATNAGGARDTVTAQNKAVDLSIKQLTTDYENLQLKLAAGYNIPVKAGGQGLLDAVFAGKGKGGVEVIREYSGAVRELAKTTQQLFDEMERSVVGMGMNTPGNNFWGVGESKFTQLPQLVAPSGASTYTGSILALEKSQRGGELSLDKRMENLRVYLDSTKTSAQRLKDAIKELDATFGQDKGSPEYVAALSKIKEQLDTNTQAANQFGQEIGRTFADGILHGASFGKMLESLAMDVIKLIMQMTVMKGLEGQTGFGASLMKGLFGGMFGGGRAYGGPVSAGMAYLVNEHTPNSEIFVPQTSGAIVNQSQIGATHNYSIDMRGSSASPAETHEAVRKAIKESTKASLYAIREKQVRS